MDELERKGIVTADERGKFAYNRRKEKQESGGGRTSSRIRGTLFMTRRGFGFVAIEGTDDEIYIAPKYLHTALHSDVVEVVQFAGRAGRAGRGKAARTTGRKERSSRYSSGRSRPSPGDWRRGGRRSSSSLTTRGSRAISTSRRKTRSGESPATRSSSGSSTGPTST